MYIQNIYNIYLCSSYSGGYTYTRQQARVLWNTCTSDYYTISNGVKVAFR